MLIQAILSTLLAATSFWEFQPVNARFIKDGELARLTGSMLFSAASGSPSSSDASSSSGGALLTCVCNTQECRSQGTNRCTASNLCYAQYVPGRRQRGAKRDQYVRGCINRSTPLLCENRPPSLLEPKLQSEWPVLHCCSGDMCNKDVPPTRQPSTSVKTTQPPTFESSAGDLSAASTKVPIPPFHETFHRLRATDDIVESEEQLEEEPDIHHEQNPEADEHEEDTESSDTPSEEDNKAVIPTDVTEHNNHFDLSGWKILYVVIPLIIVIILGALVIIGLIALRRAQFVSTENLVQRGTLCHPNKQLTIDYITKPPKVQNKEVIQPDPAKDVGYMSANTYSSLYELEAPPRRFTDIQSPGRTLANSTYCNDQFFQYSSRHL